MHKYIQKIFKRMLSTKRLKVDFVSLSSFQPSQKDVYNACLSYRHDFGLLTHKEQKEVEYEALEWLIAWGKSIPHFKSERMKNEKL